MTCKPEGTHHNACDCREEYIKRLQRVADVAEVVLHHRPEAFCEEHSVHDACEVEQLREPLQALRGKP